MEFQHLLNLLDQIIASTKIGLMERSGRFSEYVELKLKAHIYFNILKNRYPGAKTTIKNYQHLLIETFQEDF